MDYKETIGALERAFKLIEIICKEKVFTSRLIAEKMNCDIRTARKYIERIRYLFEDYIEVQKGYKYKWKGISEFDKFLDSSNNLNILYALSNIGEKFGNDKDFWKNFKSLLVSRIKNPVNKIIYCSIENYQKIKGIKLKLEEAINKEKLIRFKYIKKSKYYTVEPYKLIIWEGSWYLLGIDIDNNDVKTFSIDLIRDISIIEDSAFEKTKQSKKIEEKLKEAINIFQLSFQEPEKVRIKVSKEISGYFERKEILTGQKIIKINNNGDIELIFSVYGEWDFKNQLLKWLPYIEILEPSKYRSKIKKILEESLKKIKKE